MTEGRLEALCDEIIDIKRYLLERIKVCTWNLPDGQTIVRYSIPVTAFEVAADYGCDPLDPDLKPAL